MVSLELPPRHDAATRARHFVSETLAQWRCDGVISDAELLVSELVTNVVLHARTAATVTITREEGGVRVSVCDGSTTPPRVRNLGSGAVTGRGMLLVDRIARRWGVEPAANGKCVWFELDATGAPAPSRGPA